MRVHVGSGHYSPLLFHPGLACYKVIMEFVLVHICWPLYVRLIEKLFQSQLKEVEVVTKDSFFSLHPTFSKHTRTHGEYYTV